MGRLAVARRPTPRRREAARRTTGRRECTPTSQRSGARVRAPRRQSLSPATARDGVRHDVHRGNGSFTADLRPSVRRWRSAAHVRCAEPSGDRSRAIAVNHSRRSSAKARCLGGHLVRQLPRRLASPEHRASGVDASVLNALALARDTPLPLACGRASNQSHEEKQWLPRPTVTHGAPTVSRALTSGSATNGYWSCWSVRWRPASSRWLRVGFTCQADARVASRLRTTETSNPVRG